MNRLASAKNPQAALMQVLQNNPNAKTIFAMLQSGNSLESIARQMAQTQNIDINQLINQLGAQ